MLCAPNSFEIPLPPPHSASPFPTALSSYPLPKAIFNVPCKLRAPEDFRKWQHTTATFDTTSSTWVSCVLPTTGWIPVYLACSGQPAWHSCRAGCIVISENPQRLATHMVHRAFPTSKYFWGKRYLEIIKFWVLPMTRHGLILGDLNEHNQPNVF